ncbi:MAG: ABC transporter permease [Clostridiales bacterium]|jgi:ABC-2 type transport system permease protein|nr:ABC transporter permease [Clostridiales bacterium]
MAINAKKRFQYAYLLRLMVVRNIKQKYRRSILGVLWTVLLPLLEMLVMTITFSFAIKDGDLDPRVFIMCGVILFSFHREATAGSLGSVIGARGLLDRVYLPAILFPLANAFSALVNFFFAFLAMLGLTIVIGFPLSLHIFLFTFELPALFMFSAGIGIALSALNVYFRDIAHLYGIALMLWMYMSAVFISIENYAGIIMTVIKINPMYRFINYFRILVALKEIPPFIDLAILYGYGILSIILGILIFKMMKKNFLAYI